MCTLSFLVLLRLVVLATHTKNPDFKSESFL